MVVTAWNNGQYHANGAGYGVRIKIGDCNSFKRKWGSITLKFEGSSVQAKVNINKDSFWSGTCQELINKEIGVWLIANGMSSWPKGKPPQLELVELEPLSNHCFLLRQTKPT